MQFILVKLNSNKLKIQSDETHLCNLKAFYLEIEIVRVITEEGEGNDAHDTKYE